MSVESAKKDRGTVLAEERTELARQRTMIAAGTNADGVDPNIALDDRIRFHYL